MTALPTNPAPGMPDSGGAGGAAALRLVGSAVSPVSDARAADWISIADAAPLLCVSLGALRRTCANDLSKRAMARKFRPASGGKAAWHVHRSLDARLRAASPVASSGDGADARPLAASPLAQATEAQRERAQRRAAILIDFRAWRSSPGVNVNRDYPAFAARVAERYGAPAPSRSQVYEWHKQCPPCRGHGDASFRECVETLLDVRGRASGSDRVSPEAWSLFERLYLSPRQWSVSKCWRTVRAASGGAASGGAAQEGWSWPSLRRVQALVNERISPQAACLAREGEDVWRARFAAPMSQAPDAWAPGERWDADHARFDFFVRVQRGGVWVADRPWLSAWIDWRTRLLVGWCVSTAPNAHTVQASLLHALKRFGPPRIAWLDNGKDYASSAIVGQTKDERRAWRRANARGQTPSRLGGAHGWGASGGGGAARAVGLLGLIGVEPHFAQPYNHNGKARVERLFSSMHADFDREFDSYCGSEKIGVDRDALSVVVKNVMTLPTLDEVRERFNAWAAYHNERGEHAMHDLADPDTGEPLSPLAHYERFAPVRRVLADPGALALLEQRWERPLKVGKRGVGVRIAGRTVHYGELEPALDAYKGSDRSVYVTRDPSDTTRIRVYDEALRFLCEAHENGAYGQGVSEEARKAAHAARREQRRRVKERIDVGALTASDAQLAAREQRRLDVDRTRAALAESGADATGAPALRIVRTPVDGQSPGVERESLAKAAGAERMSDEPEIDLASIARDARDEDEQDPFVFDDDDLELDDEQAFDDGDDECEDIEIDEPEFDDEDPLGALA